MIAYTGEIFFKKGIKFSGEELDKIDILPRQRTDEIQVTWKSDARNWKISSARTDEIQINWKWTSIAMDFFKNKKF